MNQEKIGKFISKKRLEKKLTQEQLASIIGVTDKAISKWENGRCLPDVSLFNSICKTLDISLEELLSGEEQQMNKEPVIEYISYNNKQNKQKRIKTIIISSIISVVLITVSILLCYFINTYNKITIYELSGESENFIYENGILTKSNIKNILNIGEIYIKKDSNITKENIYSYTLYNNSNSIIVGGSDTIFSTHIYEDYGYNQYFNDEKFENIDNWYLEVIYEYNEEIKIEKIPVNNKIIMNNNKLYYKKVKNIGSDKNPTDIEYLEKIKQGQKIKNKLLKQGYKPESNDKGTFSIKINDKGLFEFYVPLNRFTYTYNIPNSNENYCHIDQSPTETDLLYISCFYEKNNISGKSDLSGNLTIYGNEDSKTYIEEILNDLLEFYNKLL